MATDLFGPRDMVVAEFNRALALIVDGIDRPFLVRNQFDLEYEERRAAAGLDGAFDLAIRRGYRALKSIRPPQTWRLSTSQLVKLAILAEQATSADCALSAADEELVLDILLEASLHPTLKNTSYTQRSVLDIVTSWAWRQVSHRHQTGEGPEAVERWLRRYLHRVSQSDRATPELPAPLLAAIAAAHAVASVSKAPSRLENFPMPLDALVQRFTDHQARVQSKSRHGAAIASLSVYSGVDYTHLEGVKRHCSAAAYERAQFFVRQVDLSFAVRFIGSVSASDSTTRRGSTVLISALDWWTRRGDADRIQTFWQAIVDGSDVAKHGRDAWISTEWQEDARAATTGPALDSDAVRELAAVLLERERAEAEAERALNEDHETELDEETVEEASASSEQVEPERNASSKPVGFALRPDVAGSFIRSMISLKLFSAGRAALSLLYERGLTPTRTLWQSMLSGHVSIKNVQRVEETLSMMRRQGFELDHAGMTDLVVAYILARDRRGGLARLEDLVSREDGTSAKPVLKEGDWERIIYALLQTRQTEEAIDLLDRLPTLGQPITLNLVHIVLASCTKLKRFDVSYIYSVLRLMQHHSLEATDLTFAHILEAILHLDRRDMASNLLEVMGKLGMAPKAAIYRKIIIHLVRSHREDDVEAASEVLDMMEKEISQSETTNLTYAYGALVEGLCTLAGAEAKEHGQGSDRLAELLKRIELLFRRADLRSLKLAQGFHMMYIRTLIHAGRLEDGVKRFELMRSGRFRSDALNQLGLSSITWNALLTALVEADAMEEATRWLRTMRSDGFSKMHPILARTVEVIERGR